MVVGNTPP